MRYLFGIMVILAVVWFMRALLEDAADARELHERILRRMREPGRKNDPSPTYTDRKDVEELLGEIDDDG